MAFGDTSILTANALSEQRWPKTLYKYAMKDMRLSALMGTDNEAVIQVNSELTKEAGDTLNFRLKAPLTESGQGDDGTLEGNEEALEFLNMPVILHERGHSIRSAGKMSEKRTSLQFRREFLLSLAEWKAEQLENDLLWALSGLGNEGFEVGVVSEIDTVNELAPSTNRILRGGQAVDSASVTLESTLGALGDASANDYLNYLFGLQCISYLKRKAMLATPKIRPLRIRGKKYYILLLHPYQVKDLKAQSGTNAWTNIQMNAGVRGLGNPLFQRIFDDAVGVYDDVIIWSYDRIETRAKTGFFDDTSDTVYATMADAGGVARALFLGAQAATLGYGQLPKKYEKDFDYNRKPGCAMDMIYGVKKSSFRNPGYPIDQDATTEGEDYGVIAMDTCFTRDT
jgi:N4-gp56 family major capsid protein